MQRGLWYIFRINLTDLNKIRLFCLVLVGQFLVFGIPELWGQNGVSIARGFALGGAYSNMAMGADAPFYNPANLSYNTYYDFSINLIGIGFETANNAFNLNQYKRYNGNYLDEASKEDLVTSISDGRLSIISAGEAQLFSAHYKSYAFSISMVGDGRGNVAREVFELALWGNELDRLYRFSPMTGQSSMAIKVGFSGGQTLLRSKKWIRHLGLGFGLYYLRGMAFFDINQSQVYSLTRFSNADATGHFISDKAKGGNGMTFNIGSTLEFTDCWRVGIGVQDVFSFIHWNHGLKQLQANFELYDGFADNLLTEQEDFDSLLVTSDTTLALSSFTQVLPRRLFIGVVHAHKWISIALDFKYHFHRLEYLRSTRVAMGFELHPSQTIKIRSGINYDDRIGVSFSAGLGIIWGAFRWDWGMRFNNGITTPHIRGIGAATSFSLYY